MSAVELAVAFVFFSNAVFLVAAGFVLFRMMRHTREAQAALGKAAKNTEDLGRRVRELVQHAGPALAAAPGAAPAASRADDGLRADVERLHHQARDLVQRLAALLREGMAAAPPALVVTEDPDLARDFGRLQADNQDLRERMNRLQAELGEALGRPGPGATDDDGLVCIEMAPESEAIARLQAQLQDLQERLQQAHRLVSPSSDVDPALGGADAAAIEELRSKMDHVEHENGQLRSELDALKDQIARTLREKDFIERRFLLLDQALIAAGAQVAPADEAGPGTGSLH